MKQQQGRLVFRWWSRAEGITGPSAPGCPNKAELPRFMTVKAPNRAAVHGHRLPIPRVVDEEQVQKVIEKGKEEKEEKRREVEKAVDSKLNGSRCEGDA
ncbi:hypothetical protein COP2_025250 [Malus domestica]